MSPACFAKDLAPWWGQRLQELSRRMVSGTQWGRPWCALRWDAELGFPECLLIRPADTFPLYYTSLVRVAFLKGFKFQGHESGCDNSPVFKHCWKNLWLAVLFPVLNWHLGGVCSAQWFFSSLLVLCVVEALEVMSTHCSPVRGWRAPLPSSLCTHFLSEMGTIIYSSRQVVARTECISAWKCWW